MKDDCLCPWCQKHYLTREMGVHLLEQHDIDVAPDMPFLMDCRERVREWNEAGTLEDHLNQLWLVDELARGA